MEPRIHAYVMWLALYAMYTQYILAQNKFVYQL